MSYLREPDNRPGADTLRTEDRVTHLPHLLRALGWFLLALVLMVLAVAIG